MEHKILSALCRRANYDVLRDKVNPKTDFSPTGALVYKAISEWFERDPTSQTCDPAIIADRVTRGVVGKHKGLLAEFVGRINPDVSGINITAAWIEQKQETSREKLQAVLAAPIQVGPNIDRAIEDYMVWRKAAVLESDTNALYTIHTTPSLSELEAAVAAGNRLPVLPAELNTKIRGGALPGHVLFFFARVEVGKTSFALNLSRGVARGGKKVLYLGNEEPMVESVIPRAWSCFSGMEWGGDPAEMERVGTENGIQNIQFVSLWPGNLAQIQELVEKYKPAMTVIDQVGNLTIHDESYVMQLGILMRGLRAIAKKSGTVMACFHQAGETADNKLVLELGDVSWSKTDMAAQADLMVGIGADGLYKDRGMRMLSVVKNKLSGWHGHFPVEMDEKTCRFHSLAQ